MSEGSVSDARSSVSTLDRSSGSGFSDSSFSKPSNDGWADPAPSSPTNSPSSSAGGGWGSAPGGDDWGSSQAAAAAPTSNEGWGSSQSAEAHSPAPQSNWGGGGGDSYGWGGDSQPAGAAPKPTPASPAKNSGWLNGGGDEDGWGGGASASTAAPAAKSKSGWLGGDPEPAPAAPPSGNGWLGDGGGAAPSQQGGGGWLGGGGPEPAPSGGGGGWLGDSHDAGPAPSMTQMVDHAISVEEADDFVDDSWVDEEIRDNEFDDLDIPEYTPPAPEVGGAFLKMLLVAVLVVLVGGGIMFMKSDTKTPEDTAAAKIEDSLNFGRTAVANGKKDLESGNAGLAIPQFEQGLVSLSEGKAPQNEIYDAEVLLGKALMGDGQYEEAHKHWVSLKNSGQEQYVKEAKAGIDESGRQLRVQANEMLKEAKGYAAKDEITSVKRLGREALKIYEEYNGSRAQIGNAHGILGRAHLNGREYADAREQFKKAIAYAPSLGYQAYLKQVNDALQPTQYIPQTYSAPAPRRAAPAPSSAPDFSLGQPSYQKSNHRASGRSRSRASSGSGTAAPAPSAAPRMKEIPAHRPSQPRNSGGGRKGSKGVLQGY